MKTNFIKSCFLAAAMSLIYACNPDEAVVDELNKIEEASNLTAVASCEKITFDRFTKDGNGFVNVVSSDMGSQVMVAASRRTGAGAYDSNNAANIFESGQPWPVGNFVDDILTPHRDFGGGGLGDGGKTPPYLNNIALGKLLIINRTNNPAEAYDSNSGGKTVFDFSSLGSVTMNSITIIDIDDYEAGSQVALYRSGIATPVIIPMAVSGSNGVQVLDLRNTTKVVRMEVTMGPDGISPNGSLSGSGAIDNIQFCREPSEFGCTRTLGYWKTHSIYAGTKKYDNTWALVGETTPFFNSGYTYYSIMGVPVMGNGYFNLAHQYVAATLNMKVASSPESVDNAYAQATALFSRIPNPTTNPGVMITPEQMKADKSLNAEAVRLAGILDAYNNGVTGPGHCD